MTRRSSRRTTLVCIALAGLAGAARPAAAQSAVAEQARQRLGKEHRLVRMVIAGQELPLPDQAPITLTLISDTVLAGKSTVNRYFGGFDLDDRGHIYWAKPGFATTLMAGPPELMDLEQVFLAALASTKSVSIAGADLVFETGDSATRLTFQQADFDATLRALYGRTLILQRMIAGGVEVALPPGAEITIVLNEDGRIAGRSAINQYSGAYRLLANGGIDMSGGFATTRMSGPPELMQAEDTYLRALAGVERVRPGAGALTLENAAKTIVLDFVLSQ